MRHLRRFSGLAPSTEAHGAGYGTAKRGDTLPGGREADRNPCEDHMAVYSKLMATVTEIGSLISRRPDVRGGRPCIAGTGVSVRRIAQWHNMGLIPEEIVRKFGHLSLAQVHAALAYYHANKAEINADLETEARETEALEQQHRR